MPKRPAQQTSRWRRVTPLKADAHTCFANSLVPIGNGATTPFASPGFHSSAISKVQRIPNTPARLTQSKRYLREKKAQVTPQRWAGSTSRDLGSSPSRGCSFGSFVGEHSITPMREYWTHLLLRTTGRNPSIGEEMDVGNFRGREARAPGNRAHLQWGSAGYVFKMPWIFGLGQSKNHRRFRRTQRHYR